MPKYVIEMPTTHGMVTRSSLCTGATSGVGPPSSLDEATVFDDYEKRVFVLQDGKWKEGE